MLEQAHLIAPNRLPDGSVVWNDTGGDVGVVVTMLREYDERLHLVRNNTAGQWEVWRQCEDETPRRICSRKGVHVPDGPRLINFIAKHDTRRGWDPIAGLDAELAAEQAEKDRRFDEHAEDKADKLAFALGKDLGEPAQDGRLYTLGPR